MTTSEEIVIVGAGPSGLALGAELHRLGHRPRILDRQAAGANTSRAAVVHARTLEVLEPLDVVPALLSDGVTVPIFRIRDRDVRLAEISFEHIESRYNFTLMCPQNVTERHLLKRLEDLGGCVERPAEVVDVALEDDRARLRIRSGSSDTTLEAGWLIGCDGGHSIVREQAGMSFEGGAYAQSFVLADVRMDWPLDRSEVSLFFSPDGLVVVAPLPDDRFRIVATLDEAPETPPASLFEALLHARGPSRSGPITELVWASRFHLHHKLTRSPRQGRVLLCGDSAHVHSPAGGQGMNTGIQDAISLAAALDEVLRGGADTILDVWAQKRHAVAVDVVAMTDRLTRMATMRSRLPRLIRNTLVGVLGKLPPIQTALARKLAELDTRPGL